MGKVIGVKVEGNERVQNCLLPAELSVGKLPINTEVICVKQGVEYFAVVDRSAMEMPERYLQANIYKLVRLATAKDKAHIKEKLAFEHEALQFASDNAKRLGLDMDFLKSYFNQEDNKFLFYFEAPDRLDFRELVKCLAYRYRMRIELRQVGAREKAKLSGSLGACGQVACCVRHLKAFPQVSIKLAKEQSMAINSSKSQGTCGRLMCCLQYEQAWYDEALQKLPRLGYTLDTVYGRGVVKSVNLQREIVQVQLEQAKDSDPWQVVNMNEIIDAEKQAAPKQAGNFARAKCQCASGDAKHSKPCCATVKSIQESVYLAGKSYAVVGVYDNDME